MQNKQQASLAQRLDITDNIRLYDPSNMTDLVISFPEQCRDAIDIGQQIDINPPNNINSILVTGLGGSAVGGDYLQILFNRFGCIPVAVNRDYDIPSWVNKETLVFANSYSGNTEETLSAYSQAKVKGAHVFCLTSGGQLMSRAKDDGYPVITIPGGQPPRASLGYMFLPMVIMFMKWGWLPMGNSSQHTFDQLTGLRDDANIDIPTEINFAKQLAVNLFGNLPLIYGESYKAVIANRWKCQFNENTKILAYANAYPELTHNEIMGWEQAKLQADNLAVLTLTDGLESPKMKTRMHVMTEKMNSAAFQQVIEFNVKHSGGSETGDFLDRMLRMTYLADFVSIYLAALYKVDPYIIGSINDLKSALSVVK